MYLQVAWYRILGSVACAKNAKARLNDVYLPGTGDQVGSYIDVLVDFFTFILYACTMDILKDTAYQD